MHTVVTLAAMAPGQAGMEHLATYKTDSAESLSSSVTFPARDMLMVIGHWGLPSASGSPYFDCNGDTAINYWWRHFAAGDFANAALTFDNYESQSQAGAFRNGVALHQPTTRPGHYKAVIMNRAGSPKALFFQPGISTGDATVVPIITLGAGEWITTAGQITSLRQGFSGGGTVSGQAFEVFGRNFP